MPKSAKSSMCALKTSGLKNSGSPLAARSNIITLASAPSKEKPSSSSSFSLATALPTAGSLPSRCKPYSAAVATKLLRPAKSDISTRLELPTTSGFMCSYKLGSLLTALACIPPLCANADAPTSGCSLRGVRFALASTNLESSVSLLKSGTRFMPSLACNNPTNEIRFMLPVRSPTPFTVPCTWVAPARTATNALAIAISRSLWV